ncbi:uncharacterized protein LOC142222157 [Haematobia irritans]|uniref:uncharacterized protein LOC142222157 n=1 Tax=Haematobia irritans TaxID=7368 RepID=UPI003F502185
MADSVYPNMDTICRMCLKEDSGTVSIFPENSEKQTNMSIPMRIMSCATLDINLHDGLPSKICSDCRYQLEKSYLFRKQSQAADAKLRKHTRLVSLGKPSKVFIKDEDEDDDLEFQDSIDFIKEVEEKMKEEENFKFERFKEEMENKKEKELSDMKNTIKEIHEQVRSEVKKDMQKEFDEIILPKMKENCIKETKEQLREEVKSECRQSELAALMNDLQDFLKEKQKLRIDKENNTAPNPHNNISPNVRKVNILKRDRPKETNVPLKSQRNGSSTRRNAAKSPMAKKIKYPADYDQIQVVQIDTTEPTMLNYAHEKLNEPKAEYILSDDTNELKHNKAVDDYDEDEDSDNFLIYDTDQGFELQKKSDRSTNNTEEEAVIIESDQHYDSGEDGNTVASDGTKRTTSYRIEDTESGEITFLQKSGDNNTDPLIEHGVDNRHNDPNVMILNYQGDLDGEDHLELSQEYDDDYLNKEIKPDSLKEQPARRLRSSELKKSPKTRKIINTTTSPSKVQSTTAVKTFNTVKQRISDTPKTFKCTSCPMVFSTQASFERHLRTHRKGEASGVSFQCPECHIVVSCASALRRHMFVHREEKPFVCEECGKAFVQREILKRHMQTHTGIKPFSCEHCGRAFAQRINLKQHINRTHSNGPRKQYSCHLCPKRFNHASGLSRHLAAHNGVAFQCTECERTFGDRSSIKRHIVNKHGVGNFVKALENV